MSILKDLSNAGMVMWDWIWAGIAWHNTVYYITSWLSIDILDSKFTKDSKVTSSKLTSLQLYNSIRLPHYKLTICQLSTISILLDLLCGTPIELSN